MKKRLITYLETFNFLSPNQYGFREGRSTDDALFELTKFITNTLDERNKCIAVFLDLAKAFDTVSHNLMLRKLESVGIRGVAHSWFQSYLTNRTQSTRIGNHTSDRAVIDYGVPQGTVLGPLLYLLYANDLCNLPVQGRIISFADDTVLLFRATTWDDALQGAERELGLIYLWLNKNLLTLNIDKTKFLAFSLSGMNKPQNQIIQLHNCSRNQLCSCPVIKQTNQIKYLGLIVDDRLHWDKHANELTLKLRKLIYKFIQLRRVMSPDNIKNVYYALAESIISYGILVWGGTNNTYILPVIKVQKLILRILHFKHHRYSSYLLFKESRVLNVRQIYKQKTRIFMKNTLINHISPHTNTTLDQNCMIWSFLG